MATKTHFKKLMNPNYLGAFAFDDGKPITATIRSVGKESVIGESGKGEDCIVIKFSESDILPLICNATNAKKLQKLTKSPYIEDWVGKRIVLGTEKVRAFGDVVDAVRVKSLASGTAPVQQTKTAETAEIFSDGEIKCEECGNPIVDGFGMTAQALADYTFGKYKKRLCAECAKKAAGQK